MLYCRKNQVLSTFKEWSPFGHIGVIRYDIPDRDNTIENFGPGGPLEGILDISKFLNRPKKLAHPDQSYDKILAHLNKSSYKVLTRLDQISDTVLARLDQISDKILAHLNKSSEEILSFDHSDSHQHSAYRDETGSPPPDKF
jgi:hypothetical protein